MKGSGSNVDAAADVERARLIGGVDTSPGSPRGAADFGAAYPAWCVHLLTVVTLLALCSHYIPTEWLRDPTPVRVAAIEHELPAVGFAHSTFATPSKLPHPDVMEEVRWGSAVPRAGSQFFLPTRDTFPPSAGV
jgi:hypothetical protein